MINRLATITESSHKTSEKAPKEGKPRKTKEIHSFQRKNQWKNKEQQRGNKEKTKKTKRENKGQSKG